MANYGDRSTRDPGPLPSRWLNCPRKSTGLIANKFLAFKTPLSDRFNDQVPDEFRFPPRMLFASMKSYKVRIGIWIDLTNTKRFYDQEEVKDGYGDGNVRYLKLQCKGHGETPSEDQTKVFIELCRKFIHTCPLEVIGVHCTHGFNRTGFLIVSFMVEEMGWSVGAAVKEFARYRSPGIYKLDYLEELFRRYDEIQCTPAPPERPAWCFEEEEEDQDDDSPHNSSYGKRSSSHIDCQGGHGKDRKRRKETVIKDPEFMEGVSGAFPVLDKKERELVQDIVQNFCGWTMSGFPGCQPVSMDMENIKQLQHKPYRVSWKADGTRYMMLIRSEREIYFIDRDNSVFKVEGMTFPNYKNPKLHLTDTLLDGEMVIDKHQGKTYPRYLVYDVVRCSRRDMTKAKFYPDRLRCIKEEIIKPRTDAMKSGVLKKEQEPFGVRAKDFYPVETAKNLLDEKFIKALAHDPDGLIFQPSFDPYIAGQCPFVLKWKPSTHNSVDFKLKIGKEEGMGILPKTVGRLHVGGLDNPFASMKVNSMLKELNNKIIECRFENEQWVFMRERTDKSYPNSYKTAQAVCNSIRNPVTKEYLLSVIDQLKYRIDSDIMPPPPSRGISGR